MDANDNGQGEKKVAVAVKEAAGKVVCSCHGTEECTKASANDPIAMKCTEAFSALWPDEQLIINKEKIEALLKVVLGDLYNDDVSRVLIDAMGPDENGNVTLENFFHTFSLDCWSHDSLAAMQLVLTNSPEVINQVANWKSVLKTLGFDLGDLEVQQLINKANECAKEILKLALEKSSTATEEELKKAQLDIFQALCEKLTKLAVNQPSEETALKLPTNENTKN